MKILICSDTHGDEDILIDKLSLYPDFDHYFYLGDSELSETNLLFKNFIGVSGNMDYGKFPTTRVINDRGIKFLLTHGHLLGVNQNLTQLVAEGLKIKADVICYGHTHRLFVKVIDGILVINPGSISLPRDFINSGGTYVILTIDQQSYQIAAYNRQDQLLSLTENPIIIARKQINEQRSN